MVKISSWNFVHVPKAWLFYTSYQTTLEGMSHTLNKVYKTFGCSSCFKSKYCSWFKVESCAQSMALGTRTKFQLEMLIGRIFWRARKTLVKQPPGTLSCTSNHVSGTHWTWGSPINFIYRCQNFESAAILWLEAARASEGLVHLVQSMGHPF